MGLFPELWPSHSLLYQKQLLKVVSEMVYCGTEGLLLKNVKSEVLASDSIKVRQIHAHGQGLWRKCSNEVTLGVIMGVKGSTAIESVEATLCLHHTELEGDFFKKNLMCCLLCLHMSSSRGLLDALSL